MPRAPVDFAGVGAQARRTVQEHRPIAAVPAANLRRENEGDVVIAEVVPETVMVIDSDDDDDGDGDDDSGDGDSDVEVTAVQTREEVLQAKITVSATCAKHTILFYGFTSYKSALCMLDILVRIRIRIRGSVPLTNGSGPGSGYFRP